MKRSQVADRKSTAPDAVQCELLKPELVTQLVAEGKLREVKNPARVMRFIASTERVDRMGDIVQQNYDLDNYRKNPVILWDHDYKFPLGRSVGEEVIKSDPTYGPHLVIYVEFMESDDVEPIFKSYVDGFLKGGSIGFSPLEIDDVPDEERRRALGLGPQGVVYAKAELSEFSLCAIPANPDALVTSFKSLPEKLRRDGLLLFSKSGKMLGVRASALVTRALTAATELADPTPIETAIKAFLEDGSNAKLAKVLDAKPASRLAKHGESLRRALGGVDLLTVSSCELPSGTREDFEMLVRATGDLSKACDADEVSLRDVRTALQFSGRCSKQLLSSLRSKSADPASAKLMRSLAEITKTTRALFDEMKAEEETETVAAPEGESDAKVGALVKSAYSTLSAIDVEDPASLQAGLSRAMFVLGRLAEIHGVDVDSGSDEARRAESEPSPNADRPPRSPDSSSPRPAIGGGGAPGFRSARFRDAKARLQKAARPQVDKTLEVLLGLSDEVQKASNV